MIYMIFYYDKLTLQKRKKISVSISLILYANCLRRSPVISANIHSLNVRRSPKSQKKSLKHTIIFF